MKHPSSSLFVFLVLLLLMTTTVSSNDALDEKEATPKMTEVPIVGAVTKTSAIIGFRTNKDATVKIEYGKNEKLRRRVKRVEVQTTSAQDFTGKVELSRLQPNKTYFYQIYVNDKLQELTQFGISTLSFKTFPSMGSSFSVAVFADSGSPNRVSGKAYESGGAASGSLFAMQIGDFDHSNPEGLSSLRAMHRSLRNPQFDSGLSLAKGVLSKMEFSHVWDDHDYCGNDSDKTCKQKDLARQAFDEYYPTYKRPNPSAGIWHNFVAGDAEFFVLDTRSQRDPDTDEDNSDKSMLDGDNIANGQKDWLMQGLKSSKAKWKVVISTVSANTKARPTNIDHWRTFQTEAEEIRNFLAYNNLGNSTIMVSGDLHTGGACDNGCNNRWGIPEISVAHSNLPEGNDNNLGVWSNGVTSGTGHAGFATINVSPSRLVLENKDIDGNVIHSMTLPKDFNEAQCNLKSIYTIVDTNQDGCYDLSQEMNSCPAQGSSYFGQDAQTQGNVPRYTDNDDGTVTDEVTGLMWQKDPGDKVDYTDAATAVSSFQLAGYNDWRLPTIKELYSLIDFTGTDPKPLQTSTEGLTPFIDDSVFVFQYGDTDNDERIIDAQYATSTVYESHVFGDKECFFGTNFADGRIKCYSTRNAFRVLYVRGGSNYGINTFESVTQGTIVDKASGLEWSQDDSGEGLDWAEALDWVQQKNSESYLGHNDWRLPNAKELQSIVDYSRCPDTTNSAAIDPLFQVTKITNEAGEDDYPYFWSSTTHLAAEGTTKEAKSAVYVGFGRCLGYVDGSWIDVHGTGCQRSDLKTGNAFELYPEGHGPQGDAVRIQNYVRLVRDAS